MAELFVRRHRLVCEVEAVSLFPLQVAGYAGCVNPHGAVAVILQHAGHIVSGWVRGRRTRCWSTTRRAAPASSRVWLRHSVFPAGHVAVTRRVAQLFVGQDMNIIRIHCDDAAVIHSHDQVRPYAKEA